jgi:hypothetical protein
MQWIGRGRHTFTVGHYMALDTTFLADSGSGGPLGKHVLSKNSEVRLVRRQCQHDQICVLDVSSTALITEKRELTKP